MRRLLIVEDDLGLRETLSVALEADYELSFAGSAEEAEAVLSGGSVDAMLLDERLPGLSGTQWLLMRRPKACPPVILVSANADPGMAVRALRLGASDCLAKPFDLVVLKRRLAEVLTEPHGHLGMIEEPFALRSARLLAEARDGDDLGDLSARVSRIQQELVREALLAHEGDIKTAARSLKMDSDELERLMRLMID